MNIWKRAIFGSILFGAGLGAGFTVSMTYKPAIIVEEKWRTITTAPSPPVVLGHTSLNEDELRTLLTIMNSTTTTTVAPLTTSTVPVPVTLTPTTQTPPPPSTLPTSSTTSVTETTVAPTSTSSPTTTTNE